MHQSTGKKKIFTLLVVGVLVLGIGATGALARGWGMGGGHRGYMGADPQQAAQMFDLHEKFRNETAGLRKEMAVKRAELGALWREKEPDANKIQAKQKELNALRDKMQEKAVGHKLEMRKLCPQGFGGKMACYGPGMGMGRGMGMGPGGPPLDNE